MFACVQRSLPLPSWLPRSIAILILLWAGVELFIQAGDTRRGRVISVEGMSLGAGALTRDQNKQETVCVLSFIYIANAIGVSFQCRNRGEVEDKVSD